MPQGMSVRKTQEKWNRRHSRAEGEGAPARVLTENLHLLPLHGTVLDLACGRGVNACYLAEQTGLSVVAWDISDVAVERLLSEAGRRGLTIGAQVRDVLQHPPAPNSFHAIVVAHFLDRRLTQALIDALCPGGMLFYQTFTRTAVNDKGPSNPEMRLGDGELLTLFQQLRLRVYREEGRAGDTRQGWRNLAMLVAEKI